MTMRPSDPIFGPSRGEAESAVAWLDRHGAAGQYAPWVRAVYRLSALCSIDASIVVAQAVQETTDLASPGMWKPFRSRLWTTQYNSGGLGIDGDDTHTWTPDSPFRIDSADKGALVHLATLWTVVKGLPLHPALAGADALAHDWLQRVERMRRERSEFAVPIVVRAIDDLNVRYHSGLTGDDEATWAWDAAYQDGVCAHGNAIWPELPDAKEQDEMPDTRHVAVFCMGHRNTTGGNPEEVARTPATCLAAAKAFRVAGWDVHITQQEDADADPDDVLGSLDRAGRVTRDLMQRYGASLMIDFHYEGGGGSGCFGHVPDTLRADGSYLRSAIANDFQHDTYADNARTVAAARAMARAVAERTGVPLAIGNVREPGVRSETQSGVGGDGYRLAMFAYTAGLPSNPIRTVFEFGALDRQPDRDRILTPGFNERAAAGLLAGVTAVLGTPDAPAPSPEPTPEPPAYERPGPIPPDDGQAYQRTTGDAFAVAGTPGTHGPVLYPVATTYTAATAGQVWSDGGKSGETRPPLKVGERFAGRWTYRLGDANWIVTPYGSRIEMVNVTPKISVAA